MADLPPSDEWWLGLMTRTDHDPASPIIPRPLARRYTLTLFGAGAATLVAASSLYVLLGEMTPPPLRPLLVLGVCLPLTAAASLLLGRRLARPVELLHAEVSRTVASGGAGHAIVPRGDELEGLARQFDLLTTQLHESQGGLEHVVASRTKYLQDALTALERGEERLHVALDAARAGTWDWEVPRDRLAWSPELYRLFEIAPSEFDGTLDALRSRVHPDDRAMLDRSIQVSLQRSGSLLAEVRIVSAKGGVRWANFSGMVLLNAAHGGPERIIGVARDVTDRKNGVQERDLLVKRLEREHATLSAVVGGMSDGLIVADSNHLVELCNDRALSLLGTERHLVLGRPLAEVCGLALPELMGTAGRVDWRTALSRADDQPTFEASVAGPPPRELEVHLFSIHGGADGFWTGILILDRSAVKLLSLLEERERIAMDLHDGVIQSLYAVALGLAARERTLPPDSRRTLRAVLQQTRSQLSNVIREIRDYIGDLRLDRLGEHNLIAGLQELGTQLNANGLLLLDFELDTEAASILDAEASANLLYIAHEATSNIVRHARAGSASILLQQDEDLVSLTVRDDGRGFNPRMAGRRSGDGLRNMAERARLLGGSLIVKSEPGQGAEVRLDLPLSRTQIQRAGPGGDAPTRSAPRTVVSS